VGEPSLRILSIANVPPDPNSGAAGTVYATNFAFRELGNEVDEIWADQLGPRRIRHGNLHSLIEQPRAYRREVAAAIHRKNYDAIVISQPQGYLAAKWLKQQNFKGVVLNRSHGLELRVDEVLPQWHRSLAVPESRNPWLTNRLKPWLRRQWCQASRWFDGFVLPSHDDQACLERNLPSCKGRSATIHHGIPDVFLQTPVRPMSEDRRRHLLYVGQFAFIKGPGILVEIVNQALAHDRALAMTWVTAADAHAEITGKLDVSIRDRVKLLPWVSQEKLLPLLDQHGIFLFPSLFEGAGKACAEARARGLYVVSSSTGAMKDHLGSDENSGLCPVGDVKAFLTAIEKFSSDPLVPSISQQHADTIAHLTWKNCALGIVRFIDRLRQSKAT